MKKALLVTHVGDFIPHFEMNNVKTLQDMGYEVHYAANFSLTCYGDSIKRLDGSGIYCHHLPFQRSPFRIDNLTAYRKLRELIDAEKFELLHCHTPVGGMLGRLAGIGQRRQGMKVLYTAHGFHFYKGAPLKNWLLYYPAELFLSRLTDVQITINREDYVWAKKRLRAKEVVRIPGVGIDTKQLGKPVLEDREAFRRSLGVAPDDFLMLTVGELDPRKNQKVLIEVVKLLERDHLRCLICGDGAEKEHLRKKIAENGLENTVMLLGYRNDINAMYEAADVFVLPSSREGLSVALMESMAKGLPVVASAIRGNIDLIRDGKGGYLADPGRPESFVEGINKIRNDRSAAARMGAYNRHAVLAYDIEKSSAAVREIYRQMEAAGSER